MILVGVFCFRLLHFVCNILIYYLFVFMSLLPRPVFALFISLRCGSFYYFAVCLSLAHPAHHSFSNWRLLVILVLLYSIFIFDATAMKRKYFLKTTTTTSATIGVEQRKTKKKKSRKWNEYK